LKGVDNVKLINQDYEKVYDYENGITPIGTEEVYYNEIHMGTNLLINNIMVGTFMNKQEATNEINKIINYDKDVYIVSKGGII
jgi:hypothetical protein